jgi:large conductance mechanosensitive channel
MAMNSLWQEFKAFVFKGNIIDLAVAVVIGTAFGAVVSSLVKNVIMPTLSYVTPSEEAYRNWRIGRVEIGVFLGELINFLIIASAVFLVIVKMLGTIMKKAMPAPAAAEPITRECPYCLSMIPIKARKCAHCTSDVPA